MGLEYKSMLTDQFGLEDGKMISPEKTPFGKNFDKLNY